MGVPSVGGGASSATNPNSTIAAAVQRLAASPDPSSQALAKSLLANYGVSGSGSTASTALSLGDQVKKAAGITANYALPVLHLLNRPSQAVLHTLQGFSGQGANVLDPSVIGNALAAGGKAFVGQEPDINLRQTVLGNDQGNNNLGLDSSGHAAGLIDTIGESVLDPTTYFGGAIAKAAGKGLVAGGKALAATDAGAAALERAQPALNVASRVATPVRNAFSTAGPLQGALGKTEGVAARDAIQSAAGDTAQSITDTTNQLSALTKASGITDQELKDVVTPAIATNRAPELAASYASKGNQAAADLTTKLASILGDGTTTSAERLPFQLSKDGAKAYAQDPGKLAGALGIGADELDKAIKAGVLPKLTDATPLVPKAPASLADYESKLAGSGVLGEGKDYLNHNIVQLAVHAATKDAQTAGKDATVSKLADLTDHEGNKLVLPAEEEAAAKAKGFIGVQLSDGSKAFVHPEVHKAAEQVASVINEDKTVQAFDSNMKHLQRLWKGYVVLTPHFHVQNIMGNTFMNTVAGMRNPIWYSRAAKVQKAMADASKSTEGFDAAISKAGLSAKELAGVKAARAQHVIDDSYFDAIQKVATPIKAGEGVLDKAKNAADRANPLDPTNWYLSGNRFVGSTMEHNARLAHFLWVYDKTGDAKAARESVNKYLYNYNDLTAFEKKRLQNVIPFYTFMRKNTLAQVKILQQHPGAYANLGKFEQNMQQNGPDNGTQYDPTKLANGAFPIQLPGMSKPVLVSPSSLPLFSAFQQLSPLGDLAAQVPGSPTKNAVADPQGNFARSVLQPFGGITPTVLKDLADQATGKNVATGGNIKPGEKAAVSLWANSLLPTAGLVSRTAGAAQSGDTAKLVANLSGAPITGSGDSTTQATDYGRLAAVQAALASLQGDKGKAAVPTTASLRKSGRVAKAPASHKHRAKTKSAHRSHHKKS